MQVYVLLNYGLQLQLMCICVCVCVFVCTSLSYSPTASGSFASFSFDFFLARLILRSVLHLIVEFSRTFLHYLFKEREREGRRNTKVNGSFCFRPAVRSLPASPPTRACKNVSTCIYLCVCG